VKKILLVLMCLLFFMQFIQAQKTDSLVKKLDSLKTSSITDSAQGRKFNVNRTAYNERTKVNGRVYLTLLWTDLTQEVTGPFHTPARSWKKVLGFTLLEGGLFLVDKPVQRYATDLMERNSNLKGLSGYVTNFGAQYEIYTLAAFGIGGWIFDRPKMRTTTLLATQSYLIADLVERLTKFITGRQRPNFLPEGATHPSPSFRGPAYSVKHLSTSFPSGHTTDIFAAATVYAEEYKNIPWVPYASYGVATLVGLSRITENKHWISDVFAGAALGYVTGLQVVRNYHRYAYLQNHKSKTGNISFNLNFNYDHLEPSLTYRFK
jgi:membrane-associated phospholipid phosphatase